MSTVLVVDDHPDQCSMLGRLLRHAGHDATCVTDGPAALDFTFASRPDLVLLDVMLPGLSGYDVLAALRADARTQGVPVVMYSALSDPGARQRALDLGAQEYLVKALTGFEQLAATVERLATPHPPAPTRPPGGWVGRS
ncbi:MAG: diguanylate cyclase [Phycisphaerales bacterium]|nr:diguanylate cyclase [Phycisphaerales bacterium]